MENISVQTYLVMGARQYLGGMINGQMLPPSCKLIAALSMDESTGNAKGLNTATFKCTGLEVYGKVARMDLPCIASVKMLQVASSDGKVTQIVKDVDFIAPVVLPDVQQAPVGVQAVQRSKA